MAEVRIPLSDITGEENLPKTFEEWCQIHGEPEYLYEKDTVAKPLDIEVIDCEETGKIVDTNGIIYLDKNGKKAINYNKFVDVFAELNEIICCHGIFYTPDGAVSSESVRCDITNTLGDADWTARMDSPTNSLFTSLKDKYSVDSLDIDDSVIPLANGDLYIGKGTWKFRHGEKKHVPYRLAVDYTPVSRPTPLFDKWLNDVFMPEDIPVVQEIMGYCLVPVTAAQEAFFLVGDAGVGKSGFGTILKSLLGNAFVSVNTQDLVSKRFQIASVENKLVAYDDDLGSAALEETGLLKKLITADTPISAEKKYSDPYEFLPYSRVIASTNFMLSSLYDDSDGFYRRLHPILVKPKDPDRKIIRNFYEMIVSQERQQILRWALIGLKRVIENGWKISWSQRSEEYMKVSKSQGTHFPDFFRDVCCVSKEDSTSCAELRKTYAKWCKENGIQDASDRRLFRWFADEAEKNGFTLSSHVLRGGKHVRGYLGLKINDEWKQIAL